MEKRKLLLGDYNTADDGLWTLSACKITKANQEQSFVPVPGRYAPIDFSTYLTDGEPYYGSALLEATLESSEGTRQERQNRIDHLISYADGRQLKIVHPDRPSHYLFGRVQIFPDYNDLVHCAVHLSVTCEPWFYAATETMVELEATEDEQAFTLINAGRMAVVPTVTITGEVNLTFGESSWALSAGTYILPDLCLTPGTGVMTPGEHVVTYSGAGTAKFVYREAVLAG